MRSLIVVVVLLTFVALVSVVGCATTPKPATQEEGMTGGKAVDSEGDDEDDVDSDTEETGDEPPDSADEMSPIHLE